jgi:hypothetical protein
MLNLILSAADSMKDLRTEAKREPDRHQSMMEPG